MQKFYYFVTCIHLKVWCSLDIIPFEPLSLELPEWTIFAAKPPEASITWEGWIRLRQLEVVIIKSATFLTVIKTKSAVLSISW
jgi:hypothetical protein